MKSKKIHTGEIETAVEIHALETLRRTGSEISLRSAAVVRAKFDAYVKVYSAFEMYIIKQAKELNSPTTDLTPFQKLALARLVWDWVTQTEAFLLENESALTGVSEKVKDKFTEESFNSFSLPIKEMLIRKFGELRNEMLQKFSEVLVDAVHQEELLKNAPAKT